jgi:uncharacterized protein involved in type VI secretion and phage assembly
MKTHPQNGIVTGKVSSLKDPEKLGRVRVKLWHLGEKETYWARLSTPMAGAGRGSRFVPEKGEEVLVAFEQGDPRRAYVLGSLWSTADKPPPAGSGSEEDNNWRYIKSRSGHVLRFDDTDGSEKVEIIDKDEKLEKMPAATVDSTATNTPPHIPQGGPFQSPPSNKATIKIGSSTVFINGKAAARMGDTAETCNDPSDLPVGTVVSTTATVFIGG